MSGDHQKRKFYIIAHNPNTVDDACQYLLAGANALEPDICVRTDNFFVTHDHSAFSNPTNTEHGLIAYLQGLRRFIIAQGNKINLALIMWDFKDPDAKVDINLFLSVIHDNFSKFPECAGIAMGVTVGSKSDVGYLTKYNGLIPNVGVGIDEEKDPVDVSKVFKAGNKTAYSYANGIITTGIKAGVFNSMLAAKAVQADDMAMKLIYTWVLADADAMRDYLQIHIDGIIVNLGNVAKLKSILAEKDFAPLYELAKKGYNPWGAPAIPTYYAQVHTADVFLAGTDAKIRFDLTGTAGMLSTTLPSNYKDVLEQGAVDTVSFDGANIGKVTSLKLTALTSDISSDWLPLMIRVSSNIDSNKAFFNYGPNDWVKKSAPISKAAASAPAI